MKDFAKGYRGVPFFGVEWSDHRAEKQAKLDAWTIVKNAAVNTRDEDIRGTPLLEDALCWLEARTTRTRPYEDFRKALEITDSTHRCLAVRDALQRMWKGL